MKWKCLVVLCVSVLLLGVAPGEGTVPPVNVPDAVDTTGAASNQEIVSLSEIKSVAQSESVVEPMQPQVVSGNDQSEGAPDADALARIGWSDRVGQAPGLWVCVRAQRLFFIESGRVRWSTPCSTAAEGVGARINSYQTPPGWHRVARKVGDTAPWGQVFRGRVATDEVWAPGQDTAEDLVLTRIFILEGLEPGINQGKDGRGHIVDSRERYIYIHGTNDEERLGEPVSHGCVRISNDAAIALYEFVPAGTLVFIDG